MIRSKIKSRTKSDSGVFGLKKHNEALTMRCQISLTKMAHFLLDEALCNAKDGNDIFVQERIRDLKRYAMITDQVEVSKKSTECIGSNLKQKETKKGTHTYKSHLRKFHNHYIRIDDDTSESSMEDVPEVLHSESWLKFVRRDSTTSLSSEPRENLTGNREPGAIVFSTVVNKNKPYDKSTPDNCDEAGNVEKTTLSPRNYSPSFETNETHEAEDRSKINTKQLSKGDSIKFAKPLKKGNNGLNCRVPYLNRRRILNSFNLMKKDTKHNAMPHNAKMGTVDTNNLNKVCVNGSKVPRYDNKLQSHKTGKLLNTIERSEKPSETRQSDTFEGWLPEIIGDGFEMPHYGNGISQCPFEDIHTGPRSLTSSPSLIESKSADIPVSSHYFSVPPKNTHPQMSDHIKSTRDINNEENGTLECGALSETEDISRRVEQSAEKNGVGDVDPNDNDRLDALKDCHSETGVNLVNSGQEGCGSPGGDVSDTEENAVSSSVSLYSNNTTLLDKDINKTRLHCDDAFECVCQDSIITDKNDPGDRRVSSKGDDNPKGELPTGYYEGISARYIQPVVVPPPFPGRDRSDMVMKIKASEARERIGMLVKFKSDIKEHASTVSSTKATLDGRYVSNVSAKNGKLDIKEHENNLIKKETKLGTTIQRRFRQISSYEAIKNRNPISILERNKLYVNSHRFRNDQKGVLQLPIIDCDMKAFAQVNYELLPNL